MANTERVTCECYDGQAPRSSEPFRFNVNDSLKLNYQFINRNYRPALYIPLDSFDLEITYYIKGRPETYSVTKKGRQSSNCILIPKKSIIKAILDNHGLKAGYLYADFKFYYMDLDMHDRTAESIVTKFTNIILEDISYQY